MDTRGHLIVFEGAEGVGKSTQAAILAERLSAVLTREPGGTRTGERIRSLLLDPAIGELDDRAELLLMLAARAQHVVEIIRPPLDAGRDVVCDRYSASTIAYQGYGRGLPLDEVRAACAIAEDGICADLSILLDAPVGVTSPRMKKSADRIEAESAAFHERVREGFRVLANADPDHWVVIDAAAKKKAVAGRVWEAVATLFGEQP